VQNRHPKGTPDEGERGDERQDDDAAADGHRDDDDRVLGERPASAA
jgi:hypothetical protein